MRAAVGRRSDALGQVPASSQFDLNVDRIAQHDERPASVSLNVFDTRVRHTQRIKAVCPRFKSGEVAHPEGHMVQPDSSLVKGQSSLSVWTMAVKTKPLGEPSSTP